MTVAANSRRRQYQGNGITTVFNGPMALERAHVLAYLRNGAGMVVIPQSAYTVERLGQESGTRVTLLTAPPLNGTLTLLRTMPYTQDVDVTNQGAFHAKTIEDGFDALAMQIQQLADGSLELVFDPETGEFVWDAEGNRLIRLGDGVNFTDAVNMGQVLGMIEAGGSGPGMGVDPKPFSGIGTADDENIIFDLVGPRGNADVDEPLLYRVYVENANGSGLYEAIPAYTGYSINPPVLEGDPRTIQFASPIPVGRRWFAVLIGYARPYTGLPPITTVSPNVFPITGNMVIDGTYRNSLGRCTSATDVVLTIRENTGAENDWKQGDSFSVVQEGAGKVSLVMQGAGVIKPATGFFAQTRGVDCFITATCKDQDALAWGASGDLLRITQAPDIQNIAITNQAQLSITNITTGTSRASFVMPYDFLLNSISSGGVYASLVVAQAAGALVTIDVNRNGTSIFSTRLTFDNAKKNTLTSATQAVFVPGGNLLAKGDEITIDIDQVGTALAKGLTVYLVGQRASS